MGRGHPSGFTVDETSRRWDPQRSNKRTPIGTVTRRFKEASTTSVRFTHEWDVGEETLSRSLIKDDRTGLREVKRYIKRMYWSIAFKINYRNG